MSNNYRGSSNKTAIKASKRRKDTRRFSTKIADSLRTPEGLVGGIFAIPVLALILIQVPLSGEFLLIVSFVFSRLFLRTEKQLFDFPYRVPRLANSLDGSKRGGKSIGDGTIYLGNDTDDKTQIYADENDFRTHMLVLGTTGSGKTEFLLGIITNALCQNTGFIMVDGKGDPKLQKEIFRLCRRLGREDDLLTINFITSGRDFVDKQIDKVTNKMNIMGNTSSGMLIELIVSLMDDGGGSGDMWKGRAISFVAALTRPLIYLRDQGYITLSPETYIEHFELEVLEDMVWEHKGKYGEMFKIVAAPLQSYLMTLPGYDKKSLKKQGAKTLEQHGYIVMQLTRIFNDLNYNYGHIFKTQIGEVDFYDVVVNRRCLVVLLPSLERAPDTLKMLGKMIVGNIKTMMAGCLGNRVEGAVREIIDSRATNALFPFYCILDEYGYYAVIGFAVAPAQARSLGFSCIFAAQDFSSLKKSSAEEADATFENTNIRVVGRITSGSESETFKRINGAAGEAEEARLSGYERSMGVIDEKFRSQQNVNIERRSKLDYDDLAGQENGEFTFIVGKKYGGGKDSGVAVLRGMGFYTASKATAHMRLNDLVPLEPPKPEDLPRHRVTLLKLKELLENGKLPNVIEGYVPADRIITSMANLLAMNQIDEDRSRCSVEQATFGAIYGAMNNDDSAGHTPTPSALTTNEDEAKADKKPSDGKTAAIMAASKALTDNLQSEYENATQLGNATETDTIAAAPVKTSLLLSDADHEAFEDRAMPIISGLLSQNEQSQVDQIDGREFTADAKKLLEMEVLAGESFESLDQKWLMENEISETRMKIQNNTSYIEPPVPDKVTIPEARIKLQEISNRCKSIYQKQLKDGKNE